MNNNPYNEVSNDDRTENKGANTSTYMALYPCTYNGKYGSIG